MTLEIKTEKEIEAYTPVNLERKWVSEESLEIEYDEGKFQFGCMKKEKRLLVFTRLK